MNTLWTVRTQAINEESIVIGLVYGKKRAESVALAYCQAHPEYVYTWDYNSNVLTVAIWF